MLVGDALSVPVGCRKTRSLAKILFQEVRQLFGVIPFFPHEQRKFVRQCEVRGRQPSLAMTKPPLIKHQDSCYFKAGHTGFDERVLALF